MPKYKQYKFFKPGDLVFAKLRGYAPWPARVEKCLTSTSTAKYARYKVFFFFTYETAKCSGANIYDYEANKIKLGKCSAYGFDGAMREIKNTPDITYKPKRAAGTETHQGRIPSTDVKKRKNTVSTTEMCSPNRKQTKNVQRDELCKPCSVLLVRLKEDTITKNLTNYSRELVGSSPFTLSSVTVKVEPVDKNTEDFESNTSEVLYWCKFCNTSFSVFKLLLQHIGISHRIEPFVCWKCKNVFFSELTMKHHSQRCKEPCTKGCIKYCTICNMKSFVSGKQLTFHMLLKHPETADVHMNESNRYYIEKLKEVQIKFANFRFNTIHCSTCKLDFGTSDFFATHIEQFPYINICECPFCGLTIQKFVEQPMLYVKHMDFHSTTHFKVKKCSLCEASLPNKLNKVCHMINQHSLVTSKLSLNINKVQCKDTLLTDLNNKRNTDSTMEDAHAISDNSVTSVGVVTNVESLESVSSEKCVTNVRGQNANIGLAGDETLVSENAEKLTSIPDVTHRPLMIYEQTEHNEELEIDAPKSKEESLTRPLNNEFHAFTSENFLKLASTQRPDTSFDTLKETDVIVKYDAQEMLDDTKRFVIHCPSCSLDVGDDDYFDSHYLKCFENKNFECPLCGEDMKKGEQHIINFLIHVENHFSNGMKTIQCTKCNLLFFNFFNQVIHMGNTHYKQSSCATPPTSPSITTQQGERVNIAKHAECNVAHATPQLQSEYKIEFVNELQDLIQCSELQLKKHNSKTMYTIFCKSCTKDIPYRYYFVNHFKKCFINDCFLCAFCGQQFSTKGNYPLQYICHVRDHLLKPFCTYSCECGFFFIDSYNGISHSSTNKHLCHE